MDVDLEVRGTGQSLSMQCKVWHWMDSAAWVHHRYIEWPLHIVTCASDPVTDGIVFRC